MPRETRITDWVSEVGLSFYSEDEILGMSVKAVQLPYLFDNLDQAVPGGLYDLAMGPVSRGQLCATCHQTEDYCPGHVGHIPLALPTYHPLLFSLMFKLLRAKCLHCHCLRLRRIDARYLALKLKLLRMGYEREAAGLVISDFRFNANKKGQDGKKKKSSKTKKTAQQKGKDAHHRNPLSRKSSDESGSDYDSGMDASDEDSAVDYSDSGDDSAMDQGSSDDSGIDGENDEDDDEDERGSAGDIAADAESRLEQLEKQLRAVSMRGDRPRPPTTFDLRLRHQLVREVFGAISASKCPNCSCFSPRVKQEHQLKILLLPMQATRIKANEANGAMAPTAFHPRTSITADQTDGSAAGPLLILPTMVQRHIEALWKRELPLITELCASMMGWKLGLQIPEVDHRMFFLRNICVPPNRFRPPIKFGNKTFEHTQNVQLRTIVQLNADIIEIEQQRRAETASEQKSEEREGILEGELAGKWMELQRAINQLMDNKDPNGEGIAQLLEKKTGLFRQNMMGKRVNYAARSVISPDVFLEATEVGVPLQFAQELTFPEAVNQNNVERLRQAVINGPQVYPGANYIVDETGRKVDLARRSSAQRAALAKSLLADELYGSEYSMQQRAAEGATGQRKTVFRHLQNGDHVLMNRQPSLHKPSILAHKVRVLRGQQTLRMHYANCKSYNADFDGDEMNLHFPQDLLSQSEARTIAVAHQQFSGPADGSPLRGLIQDHIIGGVMLTKRDTFFTRSEFLQILYATCEHETSFTMETPLPAILKPEPLWTGKQVVTALIQFVCRGHVPINLTSRAKVNKSLWRGFPEESEVVFRHSELLQGVMDRNQLGASSGGICHAVSVLCGTEVADTLLSAFGRLVTLFVRDYGHSCGVGDMLVTEEVDAGRYGMLEECEKGAWEVSSQLLDSFAQAEGQKDARKRRPERDQTAIREELRSALRVSESRPLEWDQKMMAQVNQVTSQIIDHILPKGQVVPFPYNMLSLMTNSGAKGSNVNFSQITCLLGQQALEGRRVPVMASGKTLPCFQPYEASARAGGFIGDRFLTGIRPAEYFFHCMAGREGLVDTAVKTARSGYLQRCLIKHLESLAVAYDGTVRSEDNGVVQFYYGEDGVDVVPGSYLFNFPLLANNYNALLGKLNVAEPIRKLDPSAADRYWKAVSEGKRTDILDDGIMSTLRPWLHLGCVSDRFSESLQDFIQQDPLNIFEKPGGGDSASSGPGTASEAPPAAAAEMDRLLRKQEKLERWFVKRRVDLSKVTSVLRKLQKLQRRDGSEKKRARREKKYTGQVEAFASSLAAGKERKKFREWQSVLEQIHQQRQHQGALMVTKPDSSSSGSGPSVEEFLQQKHSRSLLSPDKFSMLMSVLFSRSQVMPGESVGVLAGQSVGEPSTQMTLNTFHLAGHGGANVTLGVPRLREIIMTASISSAIMELPITPTLSPEVQRQVSAHLAQRLNRLPLKTALANVQLREDLNIQHRVYHVRLNLRSGPNSVFQSWFTKTAGASRKSRAQALKHALRKVRGLQRCVERSFAIRLDRATHARLWRYGIKKGKAPKDAAAMAPPEPIIQTVKVAPEGRRARKERKAATEGEDDRGEEEEENADGGREDDDSAMEDDEEEEEEEEESAADESAEESEEEEGRGRSRQGKKSKKQRKSSSSSVSEEADEEDGGSASDQDSLAVEDDDVGGDEEEIPQDTSDGGRAWEEGGSIHGAWTGRNEILTAAGLPLNFISRIGYGVTEEDGTYYVDVDVRLDSNIPKLLMMGLVESVLEKTFVQQTPDIKRAVSLAFNHSESESAKLGDKKLNAATHSVIQTEGVNFQAAWDLIVNSELYSRNLSLNSGEELPKNLQLLDENRIYTNDINAILNTYGVEAARASIVTQMRTVFAPYGISVDPRHLGLIADYATYMGNYRAFNRVGIAHNASPFQKISFETAKKFLTDASLAGDVDTLRSPSASITMGQPPKSGTGSFDLFNQLPQDLSL